jgi:hypothetical protein
MIIMVFHKPKSLKPCLVLRKTTQVLPLKLDLSYSFISKYIYLQNKMRVYINSSIFFISYDGTLGFDPQTQKYGRQP